MKRTKQNGITLIALVITIIVLLILAAVSIATLTGENGILTRANDAKTQTGQAGAVEKVEVEVLGSYANNGVLDKEKLSENLENNVEGLTSGTPIESFPATVTVDGYDVLINEDGSVELDTSITLGEAKDDSMLTETDNSKVKVEDGSFTLPGGFKVAEDSGSTVEEGIVIEDDTENQFVWVPVESIDEFRRYDFKNNAEVSSGYTEPTSDGIKEGTEVEKMYKSVNDYDGFYVGRYEAGVEGERTAGISDEVVSKKGANVYNDIKWGNGMTDETGGAVEVARSMYSKEEGDRVTSTLIYGVQWDAIMRWMQDEPNLTGGKYVQDSADMGWYSNNYASGNPTHQTGIDIDSNKSNCVKNIYDLAGNVYEWTMESCDTDCRVSRGGSYDGSGSGDPASIRYNDIPSDSFSFIGFRVTLYL